MGILEILSLIFLILKVTDYGEFGDWSWWAVFAPMWIGYAVALALWVFALIVASFGSSRW